MRGRESGWQARRGGKKKRGEKGTDKNKSVNFIFFWCYLRASSCTEAELFTITEPCASLSLGGRQHTHACTHADNKKAPAHTGRGCRKDASLSPHAHFHKCRCRLCHFLIARYIHHELQTFLANQWPRELEKKQKSTIAINISQWAMQDGCPHSPVNGHRRKKERINKRRSPNF